ncbi:hypothetical protein M427DRAFT_56944 [Gonapodya prolifera JEL478]|uniref:Radical SAM core domain-containing protein n=1 Tax=Gonapodya prolifera (strain JEL478) TaxID=1344416 RepID=A0A139AEZ5_GONPJ|nr:hypothetical protein M427DRAFT_56944 [Gonapodya prolifera JEL478]|eukprot:KXS15328.1 hypothetical protein M427DRAFT_56944 [Gonapodya prolifera JEL478]
MSKRRTLTPKPLLDESLLVDAFLAAGVGSSAKKHALTLYRHIWQNAFDDLSRVRDFVPGLHAKAYAVIESGEFVLSTSKVSAATHAADGSTTKLLVELQDGLSIECVVMRYGAVELRSFPEEEKAKWAEKNRSEGHGDDREGHDNEGEEEDSVSPETNGVPAYTTSTSPTSGSANDDTTSLSLHPTTSSILPKRFKSNQRATFCVSSQVGCAMACRFCATGTMGKVADLTAGEILEQMWHARKYEPVRGVVFMGMGEPLDNFDAVMAAAEAMVDTKRLGLSPKRISISTVGLTPRIHHLSRHPIGRDLSIALSLHAPTQTLRERIVPTAKAYPLDRILAAVDALIEQQNGNGKVPHGHNKERKVLAEYVIIKDVNDSIEVARQTGELLRGRRVLLNVIPYNPVAAVTEQTGFEPPSRDTVVRFVEAVRECGVTVMVRQELGQDIGSACGQLVVEGVKGRTVAKPVQDAEEVPSARSASSQEAVPDIEDVGFAPGGKVGSGARKILPPRGVDGSSAVRQRTHKPAQQPVQEPASDILPLRTSKLKGGARASPFRMLPLLIIGLMILVGLKVYIRLL